MNKHLNDLMEGLTAKVFRTFNASNTLQEQLDSLTDPNSSVTEKVPFLTIKLPVDHFNVTTCRFWRTIGPIAL